MANPLRDGYIRRMGKHGTSKRLSGSGMSVNVKATARSGNVTTKLGEVTVRGAKPSPDVVKANITRSTQALERVGAKLIKPGVHLPEKKGVPRYSADENNPGLFVRRLDGKVTTGRLRNGQFVESK